MNPTNSDRCLTPHDLQIHWQNENTVMYVSVAGLQWMKILWVCWLLHAFCIANFHVLWSPDTTPLWVISINSGLNWRMGHCLAPQFFWQLQHSRGCSFARTSSKTWVGVCLGMSVVSDFFFFLQYSPRFGSVEELISAFLPRFFHGKTAALGISGEHCEALHGMVPGKPSLLTHTCIAFAQCWQLTFYWESEIKRWRNAAFVICIVVAGPLVSNLWCRCAP